MGAEGKSGEFSDLFGGALGKFGMRIQSRSHRRPAKRQVEEVVEGLLQTLDVALQPAGPATELLTKRQRHGVRPVRAPNLDYVIEFPGLGHDRVVDAPDRRDQRVVYALRRGDVHRGRK